MGATASPAPRGCVTCVNEKPACVRLCAAIRNSRRRTDDTISTVPLRRRCRNGSRPENGSVTGVLEIQKLEVCSRNGGWERSRPASPRRRRASRRAQTGAHEPRCRLIKGRRQGPCACRPIRSRQQGPCQPRAVRCVCVGGWVSVVRVRRPPPRPTFRLDPHQGPCPPGSKPARRPPGPRPPAGRLPARLVGERGGQAVLKRMSPHAQPPLARAGPVTSIRVPASRTLGLVCPRPSKNPRPWGLGQFTGRMVQKTPIALKTLNFLRL